MGASGNAADVTGGIALKVEEAACIARTGIPVVIAQVSSALPALRMTSIADDLSHHTA
jgi:isopentenyl phosphate kinase